jgi:spermidine/putrescine transport system permease protein
MNRLRFWMLLPARAWIGLFFLLPLLIVVAYSAMTRGDYGGVELPATLENFSRLFDPLYGIILLRSLWIAILATTFCLVLGFPLALFISRSGQRKNLFLQLVTLPFWTSFLVRTYAWLFLLRDTGLINTLLQKAGIIHAPLPLLYNDGAVLLGLVYGYLPFMVLPLYATIERLDPALLEAAADLGARPLAALWRVTFPLALPGMFAGCVLVFIPSMGAYLTPDLLGGGKTVMAGNLIQNQFTTARDWPFGSAVSLMLMAINMLLLLPIIRRSEEVF